MKNKQGCRGCGHPTRSPSRLCSYCALIYSRTQHHTQHATLDHYHGTIDKTPIINYTMMEENFNSRILMCRIMEE